MSDLAAGLIVALPLFIIGATSPGPATLAIMSTSVRHGRGQGLAFSIGVCSGSLFWGVLAALGLGTVLTTYAELATALRIAGGGYFLWLAFKLLRSASTGVVSTGAAAASGKTYLHQYLSGVLLHLLNPKAVFIWLAVISVALSPMENPSPLAALSVTAVCWSVAIVVFTGYAVMFSTHAIVGAYQRVARWIDGVCGVLFAAAGLKLLLD